MTDISVTTEAFSVEDRSWLGSRDGTDVTQGITLDISAFTAPTHYPNGYIPSGIVLAKLTSGLYGPYAGQTAEVQTVTITGSPGGGTFTLSFGSQTTGAIAYNATAAAVQTALEALPAIVPGDVTVTGSAGGPYTVTFGGAHTGDQPQMTATSSLTGGSSPGVTVATGTGGGSSATDGSQTAVGFLFNSTRVPAGSTGPDVGAPLHWRGVIKTSRLPAASGLDAGARAQLAAKFLFK